MNRERRRQEQINERQRIEPELAKIIKEPFFIYDIFNTIKSGLFTESFTGEDICVVKPSEDSERINAKCIDNHSIQIEYNSNDLVLYGGGAYCIYVSFLLDLYKRYNLPIPSDFQEETIKTSDIDILWWPRVTGPEDELFIYKDNKIAIKNYYEQIAQNIQTIFNEKLAWYKEYLKFLPQLIDNTFSIQVTSVYMNMGVNFITVSFILRGIPYKIAEVAIHDGANSQSTKMVSVGNGYQRPFIPLRSMKTDLIYLQDNQITEIQRKIGNQPQNITITEFYDFISQQSFIYENLIKLDESRKKKADIILQRLKTLLGLIEPLLQKINKQNMVNYTSPGQGIIKPEYLDEYNIYTILVNARFRILVFFRMLEANEIRKKNPILLMSNLKSTVKGGKRKTQKKGHQLFNDNPRGQSRTRGIGYGTAQRAQKSIKKLKGKSKTYRKQVATTMYYRAKHHKYQNKGMREAMKVWKKYINSLR